jgi:hypothetical protein
MLFAALVPARAHIAWAAIAAGSAAAAGCACSDAPAFVADFEGCTGTCGWAITGPGKASIVSTILPAEHGLSIDGGVTATYTLPSPIGIDDTYDVSLVADCPAGFTVSLSMVTPGSAEQSVMVPLALSQTPSTSGGVPDYTGVAYLPMSGPVTLPMDVSTAQVRAIAVEALPGAACVVDLIELTAESTCPAAD